MKASKLIQLLESMGDKEVFIDLPHIQEMEAIDSLLDIEKIEYDENNDRMVIGTIL